MNVNSNPNCRVCSEKFLEQVHADLAHMKQQYRSSDSPRAPTCESQSPLRKLISTPRSSYLLLPLYDHAPSWHKIGAATNLPLLTTILGSQPATPSRLGGFTSKSNKCESHKSRLISSAQGLLCSLVLSSIQLSQPNSRIYTNHTISQREVGESSTMATKLLGTTSNQQNRAWNSSPPRRGLRGINSQSQQNYPLCDSQNPELPDSTTRNLRVFKPTSRQYHVCQIRNFRIPNPELPDLPWQQS